MARREDDSYTNGSVFEVSVEEGRKDKSEAYNAMEEPQPAGAEADEDPLCGMSASVSFIQQVMIIMVILFSICIILSWLAVCLDRCMHSLTRFLCIHLISPPASSLRSSWRRSS